MDKLATLTSDAVKDKLPEWDSKATIVVGSTAGTLVARRAVGNAKNVEVRVHTGECGADEWKIEIA